MTCPTFPIGQHCLACVVGLACLADLDGMTGLDGWSLHLKGLNVLVPAEELELLLLLEVCPYLAVTFSGLSVLSGLSTSLACQTSLSFYACQNSLACYACLDSLACQACLAGLAYEACMACLKSLAFVLLRIV